MDALVIHAAGDLRVEDVPTPAVGAGQARVRIRTGGICGSDLHYFQHGGFGARSASRSRWCSGTRCRA